MRRVLEWATYGQDTAVPVRTAQLVAVIRVDVLIDARPVNVVAVHVISLLVVDVDARLVTPLDARVAAVTVARTRQHTVGQGQRQLST